MIEFEFDEVTLKNFLYHQLHVWSRLLYVSIVQDKDDIVNKSLEELEDSLEILGCSFESRNDHVYVSFRGITWFYLEDKTKTWIFMDNMLNLIK